MKTFKSHKLVQAVKIDQIINHPGSPAQFTAAECHILGADGVKYDVDHSWLNKHEPQTGGYLVRYSDDYLSYSPAAAFEKGYAEVVEVAGNDADIEAEIMNKGLNAPRITNGWIDRCIREAQFHVFPGTTTTVCCLTLANGFTVTGESACASPENFDEEIGRKIAAGNARDKIWALVGYLLKQALFESSADPEGADHG